MTEFSNPYPAETFSDTYSDPVLTTAPQHAATGPAYGTLEAFPAPQGGQGEAPAMKDKATESVQAGKQAATDVAATAADKAKDVAAETKQQARNVLGQAQDQLQNQVGEQHRNLVSTLRSLSDELGSMARNGEQSGYATDLVNQASDRAGGVASWLDSREPADLVDELRRFARQKPGTFVLGALAAGVVAGRLTRGVVAEHSDSTSDASDTTGDATTAELQPYRTEL